MMPTIMVVDDDANTRAVLEHRFEREHYTIQVATDGLDALQKAGTQQPVLTIPDLMMPEIDGIRFLSHLRDKPQTAGLFIAPRHPLPNSSISSHAFANRPSRASGIPLVRPRSTLDVSPVIYTNCIPSVYLLYTFMWYKVPGGHARGVRVSLSTGGMSSGEVPSGRGGDKQWCQ